MTPLYVYPGGGGRIDEQREQRREKYTRNSIIMAVEWFLGVALAAPMGGPPLATANGCGLREVATPRWSQVSVLSLSFNEGPVAGYHVAWLVQ